MSNYSLIHGSVSPELLECINPLTNKWRVRWDVKEVQSESIGREPRVEYEYYEAEFMHKPSMDEIKSVILGQMNDSIDAKILSGFEWNGSKVWLSTENQFNYKAAFDLAVQTSGASLPVVFKFGSVDEPEYHEFSSLEDLTDFYTKAMNYTVNVLKDGWNEKDSFDFSLYQ